MSRRTQYRPDLRSTLACPAIHTNSTFIAGMTDEFDGNLRHRQYAEAKAKAAGVSTTGKRFVYQLCPEGKPFSPEAWIPESDYKDGCKAVAIKQGKPLNDGSKTLVEAPKVDTPDPSDQPYRPNDAIVERAVKEEVAEMAAHGEPAPTPKQRVELGNKLREVHAGAYA